MYNVQYILLNVHIMYMYAAHNINVHVCTCSKQTIIIFIIFVSLVWC